MSSIEEIIQTYNEVVKVVDTDAVEQTKRAYGRVVRAVKRENDTHYARNYQNSMAKLEGC
jgi:hypothetical protein